MSPHVRMLRRPDCALAMGFGLGLAPWMPGTFGALLALPLCWLMQSFSPALMALAVSGLVALGIAASTSVSRLLGHDDHGSIVWDEACGALIALLFVPMTPMWWALAFIAFRALDIAKPWPISFIETRLKGGVGVMMDDVAAGLIAGLALWGLGALIALQ